MLITNYSSIYKVLGRQHSGQSGLTGKPETLYNFYTQDDRTNLSQIERSSWPQGTQPPASYILAPKGVMLSSTTTIGGLGSLNAAVAMGRNIEATLAGSATLSVNAGLIIQIACALLGQATTSIALKGAISMASALAGSGSITTSLGLLANVVASMTGTASVTGALRGTSKLEASINVNESVVTTEQLAAQVWNTVAAAFNDPGTMGAALNDAAAGGGGGGGTIIRDDELAQGGTKAQITLNAAASTTDNLYEEAYIVLISGTGAGQVRKIKAYYGATRTCVVWNHFQVAPDSTTVYRIIP